MSSGASAVDPALLARWCSDHLGSPPAAELFRSGFLSAVAGLRLADRREVVVKVRPDSPRIAACTDVQRRMFESGYPCPEPLAGPAPLGDGAATAERYVAGGAVLPDGDPSQLFAEAFALLIRLAPRPADVASLDPPPSWAAWNHDEAGLWPRPEDGTDLNQVAGPEWIDQAGHRARDRLRAPAALPAVIGHCDWLAGNLRWTGSNLLVVHDWDSMTTDSEAVLAGLRRSAAFDPRPRPACHRSGNREVPRRLLQRARPGIQHRRTPAILGGRGLDDGLRHQVPARCRPVQSFALRAGSSRAAPPGRDRLARHPC